MRVFNVRLLRAILVTATLAFWLAGSNHCRLEQLPGMQFLACAPADCSSDTAAHEESSNCAGHESPDCADDACASIEGAMYQAGVQRIKTDAPALVSPEAALAMLAVSAAIDQPIPRIFPAQCDSPPSVPRQWQFSQRTVAPVRAPSFLV